MTRRRWIADRWDVSTATLEGEQAAHLSRVLRAEPGAEYDIVAGGRVWRAVVTTISDGEVCFNLIGEVEAELALPVTVLMSIYKFDRMEWVLEKVTELGVRRIVPVIARRTEKHLAAAAGKRVERWRRIVREASQQSRRSDLAEVADPIPLKQALQADRDDLRLVLAEQERGMTLRQAIEAVPGGRSGIGIAIGPEGGWTSEEEAMFGIEGWRPVSLGPRILRAETAAIAAISVIASLLE